MADVTVSPEGAVKLKRALSNPRTALAQIGVVLQGTSERAFNEQRLGSIEWSEPYDGKEPYVNVAAALKAFSRGDKRPPRRAFRRQALFQSGDLAKSITYEVEDDKSVVVGSSKLYAPLHQRGGPSQVRITKPGQKALAKWLNTKSGKPFQSVLGAFVKRQRHRSRVQARPVIGSTDEARADITTIVETAIAEDADQ